jgi:predicted transcriptional regulator of viral defense system
VTAGAFKQCVAQLYLKRYSCDVSGNVKYRDIVREIAYGNHGFVTTRQAAEAGVPPVELPKLAEHSGLESVSYGLYRLTDRPPGDLDQYEEAVLRAGDDAYLWGESVLALHGGLADVNPSQVTVAVTKRTRSKFPQFMRVVRGTRDEPTTRYEGIASQTVANALLACRGRIEPSRLRTAAEQARAEGLLTTAEWNRVKEGLGA